MTIDPCRSPDTCIAHRREAFAPEENKILDQWKKVPCSNCKVGIARAEEIAKYRPPACAHDGCQVIPKQQNLYCCRHSSRIARGRKMGKTCERCGTPQGINATRELCIDCRRETQPRTKFQKRYSKCRMCGTKIDNTMGYCWKCIKIRKEEKRKQLAEEMVKAGRG